MTQLDLTVYGIPAPQGSKTPWGSEANPRTKPWRQAITAEAAAAIEGDPRWPLTGPVKVEVNFVFPRPKAHYRTGKRADELRDNAPLQHTTKPDADKLMRALGDALTEAAVFRDDSLISDLVIRKTYGDRPHMRAIITDIREATENVHRGVGATRAGPSTGHADHDAAGESL